MPDHYQIIRSLKIATRELEEQNAEGKLGNEILRLQMEAMDAPPREQSRLMEELRLKQDYYDRKYVNKKVEPPSTRAWQAFKDSDFLAGVHGIWHQLIVNLLTLALYMIGIAGLVYLLSWVWG